MCMPTLQGGPHKKLNESWTNHKISILFEDLTFVETPPPMGWCMAWWVAGWVGWHHVKSMICEDTPTYGWVYGWLVVDNRWFDGWDHVKSLTRKPVGFVQSCCLLDDMHVICMTCGWHAHIVCTMCGWHLHVVWMTYICMLSACHPHIQNWHELPNFMQYYTWWHE